MLTRRDEQGIVGFNLAVVIAFALYAVIQLSRVVLAGGQIDDRVKVIITEVGPGSNVSRLDETQKLNETGRVAEEILVAAQNLSARAGTIIETAESIDGTVSGILQNAGGDQPDGAGHRRHHQGAAARGAQHQRGQHDLGPDRGCRRHQHAGPDRAAHRGWHPERPQPGQHPRHAGVGRPSRRGHLQQHGAEPGQPGFRPLLAAGAGHGP